MASEELENYTSLFSSPESDILKELSRETHLKTTYPAMLSGHIQGKLLEMVSCLVKPKIILEIGTFTGYSTICLAKGLQRGGLIHTIERNAELEDLAKKYFIKAGIESQVVYHSGEAVDIIPSISEFFDLVFIDGDKKDYPLLYNAVIEKLKPGGILIADNVLWYGKVTGNVKQMDKDTLGVHGFNDMIIKDKRVENVLIPIRDGLSIIRKLF